MANLIAFLSHSSKDQEMIPQIKLAAEQAGIKLYVAEEDINPGQDLSAKLHQAIDDSIVVIWLITENSQKSNIVQQEVGLAFGRKKPIVPIVVGDAVPDGMAKAFEYMHLDPHSPSPALERLTNHLDKLVNQHKKSDLCALLAIAAGAAALWYCTKESKHEGD